MPTSNPRLTITLTPAVAAVLKEMSQLAGNSQSAIVGELLETSLPVFTRIVQAMRAAKTMQSTAKAEIAAGLDRAQAKLEHQAGLIFEHMDEGFRPLLEEAERVERRAGRGGRAPAGGRVPARPVGGSTPVPVTRGSGPGKTRRKGEKGGGKRG